MKKFFIKSIYCLVSTAFLLTVIVFMDIIFGVSNNYRSSLLDKKEEYLTSNLSTVYKEFQLYTRVVAFEKRNKFNLVKTLNDLTNSSTSFSSFYFVEKEGKVLAHSSVFRKNKRSWKTFSKRSWFNRLKSKRYNNDFRRGLANLVVGFENSKEFFAGYIYENTNESNVLVGYFSLASIVDSSLKDDWDIFKYKIAKKAPTDKFKYTSKKLKNSVLTDSPYYLVGQVDFKNPVTILFILSLFVGVFSFSSLMYYLLNVNKFFHDLGYDEMKQELDDIEHKFNGFFEYETKIQNLSSFILEKKEHIEHLNALMTNFESNSVEFCDETISENNYCIEASEKITLNVDKISQQVKMLSHDFSELNQFCIENLSRLKQSIKVEVLNAKLNGERNHISGFDDNSLKNFINHEALLNDFVNEMQDRLGHIDQNISIVEDQRTAHLASATIEKYKDSFSKLDEMLVSIHDVNVKVSGQGRAYISELSRLVNELGELNFSEEEHGKLERLKHQIENVQKALEFKKVG